MQVLKMMLVPLLLEGDVFLLERLALSGPFAVEGRWRASNPWHATSGANDDKSPSNAVRLRCRDACITKINDEDV
jgi:hypothetical protein